MNRIAGPRAMRTAQGIQHCHRIAIATYDGQDVRASGTTASAVACRTSPAITANLAQEHSRGEGQVTRNAPSRQVWRRSSAGMMSDVTADVGMQGSGQ